MNVRIMISWLHHLIINCEMIQMVQCSSIDKKLNPPSAPFIKIFQHIVLILEV